MTTTLSIGQMLDIDRGTISREILLSPAVYREGLESNTKDGIVVKVSRGESAEDFLRPD